MYMSHLKLGDHGLLQVEAGALPEQQSLGQVPLVKRFKHVLPLQVPDLVCDPFHFVSPIGDDAVHHTYTKTRGTRKDSMISRTYRMVFLRAYSAYLGWFRAFFA